MGALEEELVALPGGGLVISHDRGFLDRIAKHIHAHEGESRGVWRGGNYRDYEIDYRRRLGGDTQPHRLRYRRLA